MKELALHSEGSEEEVARQNTRGPAKFEFQISSE